MPRSCTVTRVMVVEIELPDDIDSPISVAHEIANDLPHDAWDIVDQEVEGLQ
jgi:hypothetical protein